MINFIIHNFLYYRTNKKNTVRIRDMSILVWNSSKYKHVVPRPREFNPDSSSVKSITRLFFYFRLGHLCVAKCVFLFFERYVWTCSLQQRHEDSSRIPRSYSMTDVTFAQEVFVSSVNRKQRAQHEKLHHKIL